MVGRSLRCPPQLQFVLQDGNDVVDLSHKKIILKHLNVLAGLSLRADFPKDVGALA